ncbi:MAG: DUF167 domain-containing protein [Thermodesulfobacteriota bacterium]
MRARARHPFLTEKEGAISVNLLIQPRASRDEIASITGDALKIRLTSPPLDDRANRQCVAYLAKRLGLKKRQLELIQGKKSRRKVIRITGLSITEADALFETILS